MNLPPDLLHHTRMDIDDGQAVGASGHRNASEVHWDCGAKPVTKMSRYRGAGLHCKPGSGASAMGMFGAFGRVDTPADNQTARHCIHSEWEKNAGHVQ